MPGNTEYGGLCCTCKNAADCAFPGCSEKAVMHCEQFDDREASPARAVVEEKSPIRDSYSAADGPTSQFNGLCGDCENCEDCGFPKPEGGVWHCEEYR